MNLMLLPSCVRQSPLPQYLTTFLINQRLAIDAGSLGFWNTPEDQAIVEAILLTHSHIDHIAGLPAFLENAYGFRDQPVTVYGHPDTIESLKLDVFNNRVYPNLLGLNPPFCILQTIPPDQPIRFGDLSITPFLIDHPVPTYAYRIQSSEGSIALITDTRRSPLIRKVLDQIPDLIGVVLECAFTSEMTGLAHLSGHLTTTQFLDEVRHLPSTLPILAVHVKPRLVERIREELESGGMPNVKMCIPGRNYHFPTDSINAFD